MVLVVIPRACGKRRLEFFLWRNMARQSKNKFLKRQREFDRMKKAKEKMERRHGKKEKEKEEETVGAEILDPPEQA
jgi:predicted Fe-S protein YdhL (DUF1289 family)